MNLDMINQARQLKQKLDQAQKELSKAEIEAEAGKGAVKVTVNGQQKILAIKIAPEAIDREKPEQLEKLILKAAMDAQEKAEKVAAKQLKGLTGGFKIPGLF
jgi:DNA-binding YbaB/EbfC family protein